MKKIFTKLNKTRKKFNSENATVNIRTKAKNSIEFKIENYIKNHENGKLKIKEVRDNDNTFYIYE